MRKLQVQSWSPGEAKEILKKRLAMCKAERKAKYENTWKSNENRLYTAGLNTSSAPTLSYSSQAEVIQHLGSQDTKIQHPQTVQNLRFLHSQMSANPPSVIARATSNELQDRRAADAADSLVHYGREHYNMQEKIDLNNLSTLTYGTGFIKAYYSPIEGQALKFDPKSDEIEMTGDFVCKPVLIWDIWIDRDAECVDEINYVFQRHVMPYEEAVSMWPDKLDEIQESMVDKSQHPTNLRDSGRLTELDRDEDETSRQVEIYEYTERSRPVNGMAGRRAFITEDGTLLEPMTPNPHPGQQLPYAVLTDIDVPGEVYGKTVVEYALALARTVDALDDMTLNNIELHGNIKLVVFGDAETNDNEYTDSAVDILEVNGTHAHAPYQLEPKSISSDVYNLRNQYTQAIDGIMGVNELLQGQINRELSGFASQTAINAANMVRHRLFNKYTAVVKKVFQLYLANIQENWKTKRKIEILGTEDAPAIRYFEGADILGGYSLIVEYGTNFSLDPSLRREEIMQAKETLIEAGVSPKIIAKKLRYNEIDQIFDASEVAEKRQIEIFEKAIEKFEKTGRVEVEPADKMRIAFHTEMAEAALQFVMSQDFLGLDEELREAIYQHIDDRQKLAAAQAAPAAPPGVPAMPGMPAAPGAEPALPPIPDIGGVL